MTEQIYNQVYAAIITMHYSQTENFRVVHRKKQTTERKVKKIEEPSGKGLENFIGNRLNIKI